MTRVSAVCVDLDDTLFAQQDWLAGAWRAVADRGSSLGLPRDSLLEALVAEAAAGSDRGGIVDRALVAVGCPAEGLVEPLVAAFTAHAPARLTPYPGAREALRRLHARVPVVLVTDGNPRIQHAKVAALGIRSMLTHVVVSDELGGRAVRKPHPAPFRAALDLLGAEPSQVVHVGDRPGKDVAGAASVGMRCIRVRTGEYAGQADPSGLLPWRAATGFAEAVDILLPLLAGEHAAVPARL